MPGFSTLADSPSEVGLLGSGIMDNASRPSPAPGWPGKGEGLCARSLTQLANLPDRCTRLRARRRLQDRDPGRTARRTRSFGALAPFGLWHDTVRQAPDGRRSCRDPWRVLEAK